MRDDEWSRFVRDAKTDVDKSAVLNSIAPQWVTMMLLRHPILLGLSFGAVAVAATITPIDAWPYALGFGALCATGIATAGLVLRRKVRHYLRQPWM